MRGIVGLTLTGLGAFCVALALLLHFYVTGQVIKFPLNESSQTAFTSSNVTYFDSRQLIEVTGVKALVTQVIEGDVEAGSRSTAVWQETTLVQDLTNLRTVSSTMRRSAFNRSTGALVSCCGEYVGTDTTARQSGQGYVWPIGTSKQTYEVFDPTTLRPEPFRYSGTAPVDGMLAYEFVEHAGNQRFGTLTLPGRLVGASTQSRIKVPEYTTETTRVWVDPVSGIPVYEIQDQDETVQYAGATKLVLFQGRLTETPSSAASAVAMARSADRREQLFTGIAPLAGLLLGAVLLIIGILLARKPAQAKLSDYVTPEPSGLPQGAETGYAPELPGASHRAIIPESGYPLWLPEAGYQPAYSRRDGYQPEAGYRPAPSQRDSYQPMSQGNGYQPRHWEGERWGPEDSGTAR